MDPQHTNVLSNSYKENPISVLNCPWQAFNTTSDEWYDIDLIWTQGEYHLSL